MSDHVRSIHQSASWLHSAYTPAKVRSWWPPKNLCEQAGCWETLKNLLVVFSFHSLYQKIAYFKLFCLSFTCINHIHLHCPNGVYRLLFFFLSLSDTLALEYQTVLERVSISGKSYSAALKTNMTPLQSSFFMMLEVCVSMLVQMGYLAIQNIAKCSPSCLSSRWEDEYSCHTCFEVKLGIWKQFWETSPWKQTSATVVKRSFLTKFWGCWQF